MAGIPEHKPTELTRERVMRLYSAGVPQERIAEHLDIDATTLRRHYRAELDATVDEMTAQLGSNLFQDALQGDKQSREFWLKCRAKWSHAKPPEDDKKSTTDTLLEKLIEKL